MFDELQPNKTCFAEALSWLRKFSTRDVGEVAQAAGISASTLRGFESGDILLPVSVLLELARALHKFVQLRCLQLEAERQERERVRRLHKLAARRMRERLARETTAMRREKACALRGSGLSQVRIARRLHVSQQAVSLLLRG